MNDITFILNFFYLHLKLETIFFLFPAFSFAISLSLSYYFEMILLQLQPGDIDWKSIHREAFNGKVILWALLISLFLSVQTLVYCLTTEKSGYTITQIRPGSLCNIKGTYFKQEVQKPYSNKYH